MHSKNILGTVWKVQGKAGRAWRETVGQQDSEKDKAERGLEWTKRELWRCGLEEVQLLPT